MRLWRLVSLVNVRTLTKLTNSDPIEYVLFLYRHNQTLALGSQCNPNAFVFIFDMFLCNLWSYS